MADDKKLEDNERTTLCDEEIRTDRGIGRRALLTMIAGATGAGVASCVPQGNRGGGFVTPSTPYTGLTDNDTGAYQDEPGYGRFGGGSSPTYTGLTDNDTGAYQDQPGYGRFGGGSTGYTGLTDNDTGAYQDQPGYGRGSYYTGLTDSDSGPNQDSPGYGRTGY